MYSLLDAVVGVRIPTFALVLRCGTQKMVMAYNPNSCSFEPGPAERPRETYLAGMECWATDMLAVLSGELGPIALSFGRSMLWNALPQRFNFNLLGELYRISHPLRRPSEYFRSYEKQLQRAASIKPKIMAR